MYHANEWDLTETENKLTLDEIDGQIKQSMIDIWAINLDLKDLQNGD